MKYTNKRPGEYAPYGYKRTAEGLVPDPYQAKVLKLMFDLLAAGVTSDEIEYLLPRFKVPKLTEEREIDFEQLKVEMLELVQEWRLELGASPIEMKL